MSEIEGERSPKRQRLESYSPESPIVHDSKHFVGMPPETPPPSVRMSPSWQSQTSTAAQSLNQSHISTATMPTPPNTAGLSSQMIGRSMSSEGYNLSNQPTPATDVDTEMQTDDNDMTPAKQSEQEHDGDKMDTEHRRTDHERKSMPQEDPVQVPLLYKLHNAISPVTNAAPHASDNVIQLYSLEKIQRSVARRDPVTGEKINKLRKSYENKVKSLNLSGRNKATSNLGELAGLLETGWDIPSSTPNMTVYQAHHQGRELDNPTFEADLLSKLDTAFNDLAPGHLPTKEHEQWKSLLGLEDVAIPASIPSQSDPSRTPNLGGPVLARTAPAVGARSSAPASPRSTAATNGAAASAAGALRPDRAGKKRRYDESSYAGYDGYDDDGQPLKQRKVQVT